MTEFLWAQIDYVYFAYGLAYILAAAVARTLALTEPPRGAWSRLALYAFVRGLVGFLGVLLSEFPAATFLEPVSFGLVTLGNLVLMDFARVTVAPGRSPWPAVRFWPVVGLLGLSGLVVGGYEGFRLSMRYVVGLPAAAWGGWRLWQLAGRLASGSRSGLRVAAVSFELLALLTVLFLPTQRLPFHIGLRQLLGLAAAPFQVLRALCAVGLAAGVWTHYCVLQRRSMQRSMAVSWLRLERGLTVALAALLGGGWLATESVGLEEERNERSALEARAATLAVAVPAPTLRRLTGEAAEDRTEAHRQVTDLFGRLCREQPDLREVALLRLDGDHLRYLAAVVSGPTPGRTAPAAGEDYREPAGEILDSLARHPGIRVFSARHAGGQELAAVAAVRDREGGALLALLDLHVSLDQVRRRVGVARLAPILATLAACGFLLAFFVAQRRQSQSAARVADSERRYRNLVESSPNSVVLLDATDRVIAVNRVGVELLGLPRQHVLGQPLAALWPVAERAAVSDALRRAWQGGTVSFTSKFLRPDGLLVLVESVFTRASGPDGADSLLVGVSNDITERQRAQMALERRNRFTELILGCSSRFLSPRAEDVDQTIRAALRDLGGFLAVDRVQLFSQLDDPSSFGLTHEWCAAGTKSRLDELRVISHRSYPWLWPTLETHGFVTAADVDLLPAAADVEKASLLAQGVKSFACVGVQRGGHVVGFLGLDALRDRREWPPDELGLIRVLADVLASSLARRRAEDALREREEVFRSISDAAQDAIVMIDQDSRISVWNDSAERMFGYSRAEAAGREVHLLIAPAQYEDAYTTGHALFRHTGQGAILGTPQQILARRKDGTQFPVELSASPVLLRGTWHAVGIIRDITERLKADEALWKAKEETEAANAELRRAVERAERLAQEAAAANATKSDFLANMSHEIRTPMNGILGMTHLLLDSELAGEQREYAETVSNCAESLLTIINDILDFSKVEAGKLELELLDFDLGATLEDATDILAVRAHQKNLELTCFAAPGTPMLLQGDPGRLRQILTNLVGNAIKFTAAGEVAVTVSVVEQSPESALLRFEVRDTGVGIPLEKQRLLFQPFTQVDSSTTRRFGGTGLGLSISRRLVEMMDGEIGVTSEEGHGSTFWFTARFPLQAIAERPIPPLAAIQGLRILVVDDHESNRRVLEGLLTGWGCRPTAVPDADGAFARLAGAAEGGDPYRVVILDMMMPGIAGDELGRMIGADGRFGAPRLVMMTSIGRRGDVVRLEELGFSAYLTKPVKPSHLRALLRSMAGRDDAGPRRGPMLTRHTLREAERRRRRILLAEDNATNQRVALKMLERLGHDADAVPNGVEALSALRERHYDLVLMDVQMPEMDGFEATRQIRRSGSGVRNSRIPIIAMTAHAMKGDRERCIEAGMDDYVSKPIHPDELAAAIGRWEGAGRVEDPAPEAAAAPEPQPYVPPADEAPEMPFSRDALLERLGGDEDVFTEVVQIFLEDLPGLLDSMDSSLQSGDMPTLRRNAHSLKGSSGTVGAASLQAASLALEQAAARGDAGEATRLLAPVKAVAAQVEGAMRGWLGEGDAR